MAVPCRRIFRFSLRAMLLLVLAIATALSLTMNQVRQQAIAVSALKGMGIGCKVEYANGKSLTILELLRMWSGENEYRDVVRLAIDSSQLNDPALDQLRFGPRNVDDVAAIERLRELTQLEELHLAGGQVTDAWLLHLRGLTRLKRLSLTETRVTDAGMVHLLGLTQLGTLILFDTYVTDAGVEELKERLLPQGIVVNHLAHPMRDSVKYPPDCILLDPDAPAEEADEDVTTGLQYFRSIRDTVLEDSW